MRDQAELNLRKEIKAISAHVEIHIFTVKGIPE